MAIRPYGVCNLHHAMIAAQQKERGSSLEPLSF